LCRIKRLSTEVRVGKVAGRPPRGRREGVKKKLGDLRQSYVNISILRSEMNSWFYYHSRSEVYQQLIGKKGIPVPFTLPRQ